MESNKSVINDYNNKEANFLSFGFLDLSFILHLEEEDINHYKIKWNNLNSLKDLIFIKKHKKLWERIDLSSNIDTLKLLLQMNKITPNKIKIKYLCFGSVEYKDIEFLDFISYVTLENGLYLDSCNISPCKMKMQLILNYKNNQKIFILLDKSTKINDSKNNNIKINIYNPFSYINEKLINDCNYIYINFIDYTNGAFKDFISIQNLHEFCTYIKLKTNVKIILNLNEEIYSTDMFRDLLSIIDICIFYNKNNLFTILKNIKYNEDQKIQKEEIINYYNIYKYKEQLEEKKRQKEEEYIKKFKLMKIKNLSVNNIETNDIKSIGSKRTTITSLSQASSTSDINIKKIRLMKPQLLDKINIFNYYKKGICDKDFINKNNKKLGIVFDKFNKIYFIQCNKNEDKPTVLDLDLKIYPKSNIHNLSIVNECKEFISSKFSEYIILFIGCLLNIIASKGIEGCNENNLILGYLIGVNYIKKISEIEKYNLKLPNDKSFYYYNINNNEFEKLIEKRNERKKESLFVLDCNNRNSRKINQYNPLLDKYLSQFFSSTKNKEYLKNQGFISQNGKLLYDPLYKDSFGLSPKSPKYRRNIKIVMEEDNLTKEKLSYDSCGNSPNKNDKLYELNKYIPGHNKRIPNYLMYKDKDNNKSKNLFPFIKNYHFKFFSPNKNSNFNYKENIGFAKFRKNVFNRINSSRLLSYSPQK